MPIYEFLQLCLSQAFLGPVEIQLNDKEFVPLQFSYVDVETKEENHYVSFHLFCKYITCSRTAWLIFAVLLKIGLPYIFE